MRQSDLYNGRSDPVRVLIVDDRPLVRSGLRVVFEGQPDLTVVGELSDAAEAGEVLAHLAPNVVVLHGEPQDAGTLLSVQQLSAVPPAAGVLLITGSVSADSALCAMLAGASGHASISAPPELMLAVLRAVAAGAVVLPSSVRPELARHLLGRLDGGAAEAALGLLDQREQRLLELLASGCSNTEVARDIGTSLASVKKSTSQVLRKLGLRDRLQAGLYGYQLGLGERIGTPDRVPAERRQRRRDPAPGSSPSNSEGS